MVCRLSEEADHLLELGFRPYRVVSLYCEVDGFWRVLTAGETGRRFPCPVCGTPRNCGILSAIGFTVRPLPLCRRLFGAVTFQDQLWLDSADDAQPAPMPTCIECGEEFSSRFGRKTRLCPPCALFRERARERRRAQGASVMESAP